MELQPTVVVVDDDPAVRDSLEELVRSAGLEAHSFSSAVEFLARYDRRRPACLVLDMCMPGMSGIDLQERMRAERLDLPVIVISGHGDVPTTARSFKLGAVEFMEKPFDDEQLLACIRQHLQTDSERCQRRHLMQEVVARINHLSPREQEVMGLVVAGNPNKAIAAQLGITQRTVEVHRAHVMKKMQADSVPDLVRLAMMGTADRN
jgi:two-component system, LuxR family, response regulator FixJ